MPITIHPRPGQILWCDFSKGFKAPEAIKKRPVIILTPSMQGRHQLTTVVVLSTTQPEHIHKFHCQLPKACLPMLGEFQKGGSWLKGDLVYSVGFHRLDLIKTGGRNSNGKRAYFTNRLSRERMREIYTCVLYGMSLGNLAQHIPE